MRYPFSKLMMADGAAGPGAAPGNGGTAQAGQQPAGTQQAVTLEGVGARLAALESRVVHIEGNLMDLKSLATDAKDLLDKKKEKKTFKAKALWVGERLAYVTGGVLIYVGVEQVVAWRRAANPTVG